MSIRDTSIYALLLRVKWQFDALDVVLFACGVVAGALLGLALWPW